MKKKLFLIPLLFLGLVGCNDETSDSVSITDPVSETVSTVDPVSETISTEDPVSVDVPTSIEESVSEVVSTVDPSVEIPSVEEDSVTSIEVPTETILSIAEAKAKDPGTEVIVKGVVVARTAKSIMIADSSAKIVIWLDATPQYQVGQYLKVKGAGTERNNNIQFTNSAEITVLTEEAPDVSETPVVYDGAMIEEYVTNPGLNNNGIYIQYTGTVSISKSYYNVSVDGTSKMGSLSYLEDDMKALIVNGGKYTITGYIADVSSSKYLNTYVTGVTRINEVVVSDAITNGTVTVDKTTVSVGEQVTVNVTPNLDYVIESVTVNGNDIAYTDGAYKFEAVADKNEVSATFAYTLGDYAFAAQTENHNRSGLVTGNTIELINNEGDMTNVLVKDAGEEISTSTSYVMTAHIQTEKHTPVTANMGYGFVPYYVDDDNYIIVYLNYWSGDRPHEVRTVSFDGRIGGQVLHDKYGWTEEWANGSAFDPALGLDFEVVRNKNVFSVTAKGVDANNNPITLTKTKEINAETAEFMTNKVGVFAYGTGKATFTDFSTEKVVLRTWAIESPTDAIANVSATSEGVRYYAEGKPNSKDIANCALAVFDEATGKTTYTYSADIEATFEYPVGGSNLIGLVPYYVDNNNYIVCYVTFSSDTSGQARGINLTGKINGEEIAWNDMWLEGADLTTNFKLTIERNVTSFKVSVVGGTCNRTFDPIVVEGATEGTQKLGLYNVWGNAWGKPSLFKNIQVTF